MKKAGVLIAIAIIGIILNGIIAIGVILNNEPSSGEMVFAVITLTFVAIAACAMAVVIYAVVSDGRS